MCGNVFRPIQLAACALSQEFPNRMVVRDQQQTPMVVLVVLVVLVGVADE
jgi:hypothetical protein